MTTAVSPDSSTPFDAVADAMNDFVAGHDPRGRVLAGSDEESMARFCYVLALYETQARAGRVPSRLDRLSSSSSVDEHLGFVDEAEVADLSALGQAFVDAYRGEFYQPVTANPRFALSRQLGGADGDLIVNGCLVDLKTTTDLSMARRVGYQLVGYLLADTDDEHRIGRVGFYLARPAAS